MASVSLETRSNVSWGAGLNYLVGKKSSKHFREMHNWQKPNTHLSVNPYSTYCLYAFGAGITSEAKCFA